MAEWARLLSECWVKPVAGSNPALPATKTRLRNQVCFVFSRASPQGGCYSNPALPATNKNAFRQERVFVLNHSEEN